jgi:cytochrome-b5 reductase
MYQLLYNIITHDESPSSGTRFTLLHSSRTSADLPPPAILRPLSSFAETHPERFRLHLFVDTNGDHDVPHELHVGRIDKEAIERFGLDIPRTGRWRALFFQSEAPSLRQNRRVLFIVCGPEPSVSHCLRCFVTDQPLVFSFSMINAIVGPFGRGLTQGTVGGILGQMGYSSSEVRKL